MTISNTSRSAGPFIGNGITKAFPFSYKVFSREDVLVAVTVTSTKVETLLVLDADYSVTLNADQNSNPGGVITLTNPLPAGKTLAATSNIALVQSLDLTNQGGFYPKVINDALDRIVINIQQLAGKIGQGIGIGLSATTDAALEALATVRTLGSSAGASIVGYAQAGIGAVVRSLLDKVREIPSVKDYGAVGDGVTDDTDAIQRAFDAMPSGATLDVPFSNFRIRAGVLKITKPINLRCKNAKFKHLGGTTGPLLYIARTAATPESDIQPFYTLSRIKISDLRLAGENEVDVYQYDTGAAQGLKPDLRTSSCDGIYMEDVDAVILNHVAVRDIKGSGLVFGDKSSVRESVFKSVYLLQCGDRITQRPSLLMLSPVAGSNNGIHNHLYFEHLRIVNSFWRSIEIRRGASVAANFGTFIVEFNHAQIDNSMPQAGPMGPDCDMVLLEHVGWHIVFNKCVILNPYGPGGSKWGNACVRIGTDNYPNSTAERVTFHQCRFQHASYGIGVKIQRANVVRFTKCSWASDATSRRSIVVANYEAADNYGVCSDVFVTPYLMFDGTNDFSDKGIFYANPVRRTTTHGAVNKSTPSGFLTEAFYPGGFRSGYTRFTTAATANTNTVLAIKDFSPGQTEDDINNTTWLISASAALADGSVVASGSAVATFVNANIVGRVFPLGPPVLTDPAKLDMSIMTPGGAAAGGFIPGSGNRVQIYIGNPDGLQIVGVDIHVMRWGS